MAKDAALLLIIMLFGLTIWAYAIKGAVCVYAG